MSRAAGAGIGHFQFFRVGFALGDKIGKGRPARVTLDGKRHRLPLDAADVIHGVVHKVDIADIGCGQNGC